MFKELKKNLKDIINRGEDLIEIYGYGGKVISTFDTLQLNEFIVESKRLLELLNIRGPFGKVIYEDFVENNHEYTMAQEDMVKFLNFEIETDDIFDGYPSIDEMNEESRRQNIEEQHARIAR